MSFQELKKYESLLRAGEKCCNGGRWKPSVQSFEMTLLRNTSRNKKDIENRTYKPSKTNDFDILERGKKRDIKAHSIKDRQVYKSFCKHELKPCIQNQILPNNAASQIGKGTEWSIKMFRQGLAKATRKWGNDFYVVTFDYHNYFGSIPHDKIIERINVDDESAWLLQQYVDLFQGDYGIGIGGEPSQDISTAFPSKIDRMLACDKLVLSSGRYMDDGYAICHKKDEAAAILERIREASKQLGLIINEKRTKISCMKKESVIWLKKRTYITKSGRIVMRLTRENVRDELRRIQTQKKLIDKNEMPISVADVSIECWCSYAQKYNSKRAVHRVVRSYMSTFDVPWDVAKLLLRKRHKGWCKIINEYRRNQK